MEITSTFSLITNPYFQQPERFDYMPQQDWNLQQVQENPYGQVPDQFDVERQPQQLEEESGKLERQNERQSRELTRLNQEITRMNREVNRVNQEITRLSQNDQRHTNRLNDLIKDFVPLNETLTSPSPQQMMVFKEKAGSSYGLLLFNFPMLFIED